VDLGFEDEVSLSDIEILGYLKGLFGSGGDVAALDEDSVFPHEIFGLILVKIEVSADCGGELLVEERLNDS
jgi:hypothetical protein